MIILTALSLTLATSPAGGGPDPVSAGVEHRLLATTRTATMEKELRAAAAEGFRLVSFMGGETSFGGDEIVAIVARERDGSGVRFAYRLLATSRTSTMQKELNQAARDGFRFRELSIAPTLAGHELLAILERPVGAEPPPLQEYRVQATKRTSTLHEELGRAGEDGWTALDVTVSKTMFAGSEVVAVLGRAAPGARRSR